MTLFQTIYPELTHWVVSFEISTTVPVCCIAGEYDVTSFTVKHKKLKIRHNLMYLKMYTAQVCRRFHHLSLNVLKT